MLPWKVSLYFIVKAARFYLVLPIRKFQTNFQTRLTGLLRHNGGLERAHHLPRNQGDHSAQAGPRCRGGDPGLQIPTAVQGLWQIYLRL